MLDVNHILKLQIQLIIDWHKNLELPNEISIDKYIIENNMWNFLLWHEEDIARINEIDPLRIVEAKRNIDNYNQQRNNAIEKIDEWILIYLESKNIRQAETLHSETPGMMIDRLSIMALKKFHMHEETLRSDATLDHRTSCSQKVSVLEEQIKDLAHCLVQVLDSLEKGQLNFKVYRQFKMYNDPTLNPQLYKNVINL